MDTLDQKFVSWFNSGFNGTVDTWLGNLLLIALSLFLAALLAGVIGFEREYHERYRLFVLLRRKRLSFCQFLFQSRNGWLSDLDVLLFFFDFDFRLDGNLPAFAGLFFVVEADESHGIVIKGAAYFDKLNELGILVSDKTGTLTYGDFRLTKVVPVGLDEGRFATYLRAAECRSTHPLAKAILKGANAGEISAKVASYSEIAGKGEKCVYEGKTVLAGRQALFAEEGIAVPEVDEVGSVVYLAVEGKYAGYVVLNDMLLATFAKNLYKRRFGEVL